MYAAFFVFVKFTVFVREIHTKSKERRINRMKTKEFKRLKARFTKFPDKIPKVNGKVTVRADGKGVMQFEFCVRN